MSNHIVLEMFTDQDLEPKSRRSEWFWTLPQSGMTKKDSQHRKKDAELFIRTVLSKTYMFQTQRTFLRICSCFPETGSFFHRSVWSDKLSSDLFSTQPGWISEESLSKTFGTWCRGEGRDLHDRRNPGGMVCHGEICWRSQILCMNYIVTIWDLRLGYSKNGVRISDAIATFCGGPLPAKRLGETLGY